MPVATRRAASTPATPAPRPSWSAPPSPSGACCGDRPGRAGRAPRCGAGAVAGVIGTALLWLLVPPSSLLVFRGGFFVAALCTAGVIACVAELPSSRLATVLCLATAALRGPHLLRHVPLVLARSCWCCRAPAPTSRATRSSGSGWWRSSPWPAPRPTSSSCPSAEAISRGGGHRLAMPVAASLAVLTTFLATVGVSDVAAASVGGPATATPSGGARDGGRAARTAPRTTRRAREGAHRRGLGGGHARGRARPGDGAVRRGGGERGQPGLLGVDGPVGEGAVVHRPARDTVRRTATPTPSSPSGAPGWTSSTPTSSSTWPGATCSTRRSNSTWTNIGVPAFDSYVDEPVPPGHRRPRLARRARGLADLAVLRHRRRNRAACRGPRTIPAG